MTLVHLINRHDTQSSDVKDFEFSRATVRDLWKFGHDDINHVLTDPSVCTITEFGNGLRAFDV
jgi:NTE family protein